MIRPEDRISEVLARNEGLVEVLANFSPHFEKLRNPSLRRVLGRLVTVRDAAGVAGTDLDALLRALNGGSAGESGGGPAQRDAAPTPSQPRPLILDALLPDQIIELDVRDDLRAGIEPFGRIMAAAKEIGGGKVLRLRATFEPVPLYHVMAKRGLDRWTERLDEDDWVVWFFAPAPNGAAVAEREPGSEASLRPSGGPKLRSSGEDNAENGSQAPPEADREPHVVVRLDVRGLEPPEPMMRTLEAIDALPSGGTLIQTNVRVPRFLIEELNRRGLPNESRTVAPGIVELTIRKP